MLLQFSSWVCLEPILMTTWMRVEAFIRVPSIPCLPPYDFCGCEISGFSVVMRCCCRRDTDLCLAHTNTSIEVFPCVGGCGLGSSWWRRRDRLRVYVVLLWFLCWERGSWSGCGHGTQPACPKAGTPGRGHCAAVGVERTVWDLASLFLNRLTAAMDKLKDDDDDAEQRLRTPFSDPVQSGEGAVIYNVPKNLNQWVTSLIFSCPFGFLQGFALMCVIQICLYLQQKSM